MKIKITQIEKIISLLLSKLKETQGDEIELKNDFYWDISDGELFNPYQEPRNITLGQLSDDLIEIQRLNESDDGIPYDLKRISTLLKALIIENPTAF